MPERRSPSGVVEVLRLLAIVFCAGIGYQLGGLTDPGRNLLGPFNGVALGVIVGSGLGYVIGGVLGRTTITAVDRVEFNLRDVTADSLLAGGFGLLCGVVFGAAIGWPLFLLPQAFIAFPVFGFLLAVSALVGFRVGQSKQDGILAVFGPRAGMAPRRVGASLLPRVVDTSVAIDGRILDIVRAGFLHGTMLIAKPVLDELQGLADAGDDTRRAKGRRGLETLEVLRREPGIEIEVLDEDVPDVPDVDAKLVRLCLFHKAALLTLDTNLAKAAALAGIAVLNLHQLTQALRPPVQAGDEVSVLLLKPGKEAGQAVGYLDDGTMVVAEHARAHVGRELPVRVTSVLTTANGRMVFAQPAGDAARVPSPAEMRPRGGRL
ncbi:MAG: PIN/TRAM domain-containing protein [Mycobacteriales bacterium]